ncbi:glycosyltransferase family 61 protein [Paenirhodobacter sp.]|uniref:glycosyltransferase family 61 protein n=1 Tax=Paenirhodobacter sp. TaxID=1965326 RepID=UPI003B3F9268
MQAHIQNLGVFDQSGKLIQDTIGDRHHGTHLYRAADLDLYDNITDAEEPEGIYAGVFFHHYGHFLLESLARLWYAKSRPDLPVVWIGVDSWPTPPQFRSWQKSILDIIGIKNPLRVLIRPERFSKLHVPEPGYRYADWCHPDHAKFLAAYDGSGQIPGRKLWLSRKNVENSVGIINSPIFESRLKNFGWDIFCPELHSVPEQLNAFATAEVIGGEEGSAFHSLLLLKDVSQKTFHVFRRNGPEHMSFHTIGNARNVRQFFHSTSNDAVISKVGREVRRLAPNAAQVMNCLKIPISRSSVKSTAGNWSLRRINRIGEAIGANSYLEFSVGNGAVFHNVKIPTRVGVGEKLGFDVRAFTDPGTSFFEVSPKRYLQYFSKGKQFDLIFINNCHLFEDTIRTFTLATALAHERSVFLIDNVFPVDRYSADRDHARALELRKQAGSDRKAWHGDVYKSIFAIDTFFPHFRFLTIQNDGNPQTVVWRDKRDTPHLPSSGVNAISFMDYDDMMERSSTFRFASEDEVIAELRSDLALPG